jgi:hypothetical protein
MSDFETVALTKDGQTRNAETPSELMKLRYDGWVESDNDTAAPTEKQHTARRTTAAEHTDSAQN